MDYKKILYISFQTFFSVLLIVLTMLTILGDVNIGASGIERSYRLYVDGIYRGSVADESAIDAYFDDEVTRVNASGIYEDIKKPENIKLVPAINEGTELMNDAEIRNVLETEANYLVIAYEMYVDDQVVLYANSTEVIDRALELVLVTFAGTNEYNSFVNEEEYNYEEYGQYLEDVYVNNKIQYKRTYAPIKEVYVSASEVAKHLTFGDTEESKYVVASGDTLEGIAYNHELGVDELMLANPELSFDSEEQEQSLLYPGQVLNVSHVSSTLDVRLVYRLIQEEVVPYSTEYQSTDELTVGYTRVVQDGIDGLEKVEYLVEMKNGIVVSQPVVRTTTLVEAQSRIVQEGTYYNPKVGNPSRWRWPASSRNMSTRWEYRWGKFHYAIDITGSYNSPIRAANSGYVQEIYFDNIGGFQVLLNHGNGWYTLYAHLATNPNNYVTEGSVVSPGTIIGGMGRTGFATGVHLHFEVWKGGYPYKGGTRINPLSLSYYY